MVVTAGVFMEPSLYQVVCNDITKMEMAEKHMNISHGNKIMYPHLNFLIDEFP